MQPQVQPLSVWRRKLVFGSLLFIFLISLPVFIFYAKGFRYNFSINEPSITATGGFYLLAEVTEGEIFIDEKPVKNVRTFRNASYIQGLVPGVHRLHVQAPGTHTWVKELTVSAQIVTEAESFNLPLQPQVRLVSEYLDETGRAVIFGLSSSTPVLQFVSSSTLVYATSTATSSYRLNQEFVLLRDLLAEQASSTALRRQLEAENSKQFGFSTSTVNSSSTLISELATTTVTRDNLTLFEKQGEIFARVEPGSFRNVPNYFCTFELPETDLLGASPDLVAETTEPTPTLDLSPTSCREEILIDRQGQEVLGFDFYPNNANLVLLHLTNGIYVVEIDDRAWQNAQPLYLGEALELLLYRGGMYVKEGKLIFEVLPEIITP